MAHQEKDLAKNDVVNSASKEKESDSGGDLSCATEGYGQSHTALISTCAFVVRAVGSI